MKYKTKNKNRFTFDKYIVYAPKDIPPELVEVIYKRIKEKRQLIWAQTFKGRYIGYIWTQIVDGVEYWMDYSLDLKDRQIIFRDISPRCQK